jgi:dolichol-phosphate mannosyltransferase
MSGSEAADVTVLVPALNEEDTIAEVVDRLLALPLSKQVIVIDDGSTDKTPQILQKYKDQITILTNPARSGKGAAIVKALPHATGKVVIIQDADLEYLPEEIPKLVEPILKGQAGVVYGTRFAEGLPRSMALPNKLVNILLALSVRVGYWQRITDEATCYKAVRRDLLMGMDLQCRRFEFCPEVTAKSIRMGQKILEVPIHYEARSKAAGKKIRWTDAPEAFWTLMRYRFWKAPQTAPAPAVRELNGSQS